MAVNYGGGIQGALGGAGTGAAIGSFIPVVGPAIGAAVGGAAGGLGGLFGGGSEGQVKQNQRFTSPQSGLQDQTIQQALALLQGGAGNAPSYTGFEPIAQEARTGFYQQTIPTLAERFTALGGGQRSSAFQGALGQAGAGLERGLAALRSQYGLQQQGLQQNQLRNLLNFGLQPSFENYYQKAQPGFGEELFKGALGSAPQFYQAYQQNQQNQELVKLLDLLRSKQFA